MATCRGAQDARNHLPERQPSLLTLAGSGRGLWGDDSAAAIAALRDKWGR